jgi:hypothetical protein
MMTNCAKPPHFVVNIIFVNSTLVHNWPVTLAFSIRPIRCTQTGIRRLFAGTALDSTKVCRSGACASSIAAAKSSALVSTNSSISSLIARRKFAARLSFASRTCLSSPLLQARQYCTNLRSRSSTVCGAFNCHLPRDAAKLPVIKRESNSTYDVVVMCVGALIALFLLLPVGICANELPESPRPTIQSSWPDKPAKPIWKEHRFWDRANKVEAWTMAGLAGFDAGQTCHNISTGGHEYWLTQSCAKDLAVIGAINTGTLGVAWLLHRTGHHKLERLPMLWKSGDSLHAIVFSKMHGAW